MQTHTLQFYSDEDRSHGSKEDSSALRDRLKC